MSVTCYSLTFRSVPVRDMLVRDRIIAHASCHRLFGSVLRRPVLVYHGLVRSRPVLSDVVLA